MEYRSVSEFMERARKHQKRIQVVRWDLSWISILSARADQVLEKLAPEKLPKPRTVNENEEW